MQLSFVNKVGTGYSVLVPTMLHTQEGNRMYAEFYFTRVTDHSWVSQPVYGEAFVQELDSGGKWYASNEKSTLRGTSPNLEECFRLAVAGLLDLQGDFALHHGVLTGVVAR
jgi:hypothetical protein